MWVWAFLHEGKMNTETFYLLLGVFIGVLSTLLQTIVSHILRQREKTAERQRQIKENRINNVESACAAIIQHINSMNIETPYLYKNSLYQLEHSYESYWEIWKPLQDMVPLKAAACLLRDSDLLIFIEAFIEVTNKAIKPFADASLQQDRGARLEMIANAVDLLGKQNLKILETYNNILERLDYLRTTL
jgi:hypothetical protein